MSEGYPSPSSRSIPSQNEKYTQLTHERRFRINIARTVRQHLLIPLITREPRRHLRYNARKHRTKTLVQSQGSFTLHNLFSRRQESTLWCL